MADSRSPDAIQREIEATRAELADTIDAIADRVSPKKAATRSAAAVKAKASAAFGAAEKAVSDVTSKVGDAAESVKSSDETEPGIGASVVPHAESGTIETAGPISRATSSGALTANGRPAAILDATPQQAARAEGGINLHQRRLRTDRVLLTVGAGAAAVAVIVLIRGRKS